MRVVLSTYDSRGGVEPLAGLAVQLQALGAEVTVCAPPDEEFAQRLTGLGVPLVSFGDSARTTAAREAPPSQEELRRQMDDLIAAQFGAVAAAAEGSDALVSTNLLPTSAGVASVAEKLGIHYVYASYQPSHLPSPHHPPPAYAGLPFQMGLVDYRELWDQDAHNSNMHFGTTLNRHRASIGLPPVTDVRTHAFTERPWLAADPALAPWPLPAELDVVQTGAWLLPDERPLPAELLDFLEAGTPPVYVGTDIAGMAIKAIRAQGRRVLLPQRWAELAPVDDRDDCFLVGEINHQELFGRVAAVVHHGGAGTTTTAAAAGAPQVVVTQGADQVYWAGRATGLGIGTAYDGRSGNYDALCAAVEAALAPETARHAKVVADKVRTDGAAVAATLLTDAISRG